MNPRQIKAENRFIIAMATIIAFLIIIAMIGYLTGGWEQQP
jgi:uncharacterized membrane protein